MKTMLIDDSRTMRNLHKGVLVQLGHSDIVESATAEDALEVFDTVDPDLVLIDRSLPGMDGHAFIRAVRARGTSAAIIVVSCETHRAGIVDAINAGATTCIAKPCTPDFLAQRITETLERARSA
jgi:two-component system chemotaxis response regulator CheY